MQSIAWKYHIGLTTVHKIVIETCKAIWSALNGEYLKSPNSTEMWLDIASGFEAQWNFPHCIGAVDGKHINVQAPKNSGSLYFNYKKTFSIVLLASCDSKYQFTMIDVGAYGSQSDGGVFKNSPFGCLLENNVLQVPEPKLLPGTNILHPYTIVADEAFPLKTYIMRPYPGKNLSVQHRIFNYRLCRARRVIENAFGILVNRWRLLRTTIVANEENVDAFVKAAVVLHNFSMEENIKTGQSFYCPKQFVDSDTTQGTWRDEVDPLNSVGRLAANRTSRNVYLVRDELARYFSSRQGEVPWQYEAIL